MVCINKIIFILLFASLYNAVTIEVRTLNGDDSSLVELQECTAEDLLATVTPYFGDKGALKMGELLLKSAELPAEFVHMLQGYVSSGKHFKLTRPILNKLDPNKVDLTLIACLEDYYLTDATAAYAPDGHDHLLLFVDYLDYSIAIRLKIIDPEHQTKNPVLAEVLEHSKKFKPAVNLQETQEMPALLSEELRFEKDLRFSINVFETGIQEYTYQSANDVLILDQDNLISICNRISRIVEEWRKPGGRLVELELIPHPLFSENSVRGIYRFREQVDGLLDAYDHDGALRKEDMWAVDSSTLRFLSLEVCRENRTGRRLYRDGNSLKMAFPLGVGFGCTDRKYRTLQASCYLGYPPNRSLHNLTNFVYLKFSLRFLEYVFKIEYKVQPQKEKLMDLDLFQLDFDQKDMWDLMKLAQNGSLSELLIYFATEFPLVKAKVDMGSPVEVLVDINPLVSYKSKRKALGLCSLKMCCEFGNMESIQANIAKVEQICVQPILTIRPVELTKPADCEW